MDVQARHPFPQPDKSPIDRLPDRLHLTLSGPQHTEIRSTYAKNIRCPLFCALVRPLPSSRSAPLSRVICLGETRDYRFRCELSSTATAYAQAVDLDGDSYCEAGVDLNADGDCLDTDEVGGLPLIIKMITMPLRARFRPA